MFTYPPKPTPGDAIAVLSPSAGLPAQFPAPFELGLRRLRDEFQLRPVEYPTTRHPAASPAERARDIEAAFADDEIRAVIASIGGDDQIRVLAHLDAEVLARHPKPFFGYSDNTNLHLFLWRLGIVSYHGGSVMVELARPGSMNPTTRESLRRALFSHGPSHIAPAVDYTDENKGWVDPANLLSEPVMRPAAGWTWHGPAVRASGPGWGGCLEIVDYHLRVGKYLLPAEAYAGCVLFLETSEELPSATYVRRVLLCMGERGMLAQFAAVVWGRPKAWSFAHPVSLEERARFTDEQRDAVVSTLAEYNPEAPIVFGVDIGHTDPQYVVPSGGIITVDAAEHLVEVMY